MAESFAAWPEAVPTTLEIAERCDVELELGQDAAADLPAPDGSEPAAYLRTPDRGRACASATATRRPPQALERLETRAAA